MKRLIAITGFLAFAVLIGAAYPLLVRGPEIGGAEWQYPWYLLALLLVPWLFWRGTFGEDARRPRLLLGTVQGFARGPVGIRVWLRDLPGVLRAVGFVLLVLAMARPLNAVVPTSSEEEGIDLVLVLDLSGSMRAVIENFPEDLARLAPDREPGVRATRLDAAKATIRDFVSRSKTDRIGVVVFGKAAYVLSPPTLDYQLLDTLVSRLRLDLIDPSRTAIGDALGVAMARLRRSQAASKAVILLTDGDNNAGEVAPEYAAHLATVVGARVYTVQIGAGDKAEVHDGFDLFGQPRYSTRYFPVNAELLESISKTTGGESYVATDATALQASLHDVLDRLEKTKFEAHVATFEDLYRYLLLPGVLLIALDAVVRALVLREVPVKFAEPFWLLGTLLALLVGGLLVWGALRGVQALRRFGEEGPVEALLTAKVGTRRAIKGALSVLGLAACFVALAQPQYGWGTRRIPATNLDVIVVLDYSKSMYARDVAPNRTERAKSEVARLIAQLPGARFGAVAFAGEPLSFPLTSDGGAIAQFFRQLTPHDMPVGGTAIARALDAGRSLLDRDPQSSKHKRVMLLVTDGEDLEGDPAQAAKQAKAAGTSIFVVQIGGRTPEPIPDIDEQGADRGLRRNDRGEVMTTALSAEGEQQLAQIAEITGGNVVQSGGGSTGIEEIARRLRAMMTEELSERVETVYADVYAYPLAVALLLLALEAFVPEMRARRRRSLEKRSKAASLHAAAVASAEGHGGAGEPRTRTRRGLDGVGASALLLALGASQATNACNSAVVDDVFTRHSPQVDDAISALQARDAGAAERQLGDYLGVARCQQGSINASPALADRAQASFDLGLALFQVGERFGARFGDDPGQAADDARLLAKRSEEVSCALSVVRELVARHGVPLELRAQSYYLLGNLEFLRREYEAAIKGYDGALALVPGDDAENALAVGRDAAHNRALALRLREEEKPPPENPDAGPKDQPGDGGTPPDEPPPPGDGGKNQPQKQDDADQKDQDQPKDDQKPDPSQNDQQQDQQSQQDQPKDQQPQPSPDDQQQPQQDAKDQKAAPTPQNLSLSQDDKMLDQLERAPTVQQEAARAQRGRVRRVVEDK